MKIVANGKSLTVREVSVGEEDYDEAVEQSIGYCPVCEQFTREMTEPDAQGLDCNVCETKFVVGAEQALMMGLIEFGS